MKAEVKTMIDLKLFSRYGDEEDEIAADCDEEDEFFYFGVI